MSFFKIDDSKKIFKSKNETLYQVFIFFIINLIISLLITSIKFSNIFFTEELINLTYSENKVLTFSKSIILFSITFSFVDIILFYFFCILIKPSGNYIIINKNFKNIIFLIILSLFGNLAYIVISMLFSSLKLDDYLNIFITTILVNIYCSILYKLYLENMSYSNYFFYEICRFIIVGLIAAVFDFITCYIFQFIIFKNNVATYVTIISTICGFIIGFIINYLLSTYMVYKKTDNKNAKNIKGVLIFLLLAIIGLLIGIVIQFLFYDYLNLKKNITFFSYPLVFILRTLIVMVYNYISRKLIIYK